MDMIGAVVRIVITVLFVSLPLIAAISVICGLYLRLKRIRRADKQLNQAGKKPDSGK